MMASPSTANKVLKEPPASSSTKKRTSAYIAKIQKKTIVNQAGKEDASTVTGVTAATRTGNESELATMSAEERQKKLEIL